MPHPARQGQALVKYALILALVVIVTVLGLRLTAGQTQDAGTLTFAPDG